MYRYMFIQKMGNFNSHAPRGARRNDNPNGHGIRDFNSHAPRGARPELTEETRERYISTHTPLAGRDAFPHCLTSAVRHFNSHAPRGARRRRVCDYGRGQNFNSHAPRGARLKRSAVPRFFRISTHTPLAGRDDLFRSVFCTMMISTHTPLAGRDGGF